eukprot:1581544-Rhodomonas_salina.1
METFALQCGARRDGLFKRLTTARWGAISASLSPPPVPRSEIYLSDSWAGGRTGAQECLEPTSTACTKRRRSGWVAECGAGA